MSYKGSSSHAEEKIMLARDEKDNLYEPKPNKKAIRILTVAAYVLCVSLAAIMLSLYYVFFWDPTTKIVSVKPSTGCTGTQVSESEYRKITGKEKKAEVGRPVNPSIGPSIPTAIINRNLGAYDVKEIQMEYPSPFVAGNLLLSSTLPPESMDMQSDQEADDNEYQGDEMEEFEEDESSGQGSSSVPEYKSNSVNMTNSGVAAGEDSSVNGNEI